MNREPKPLDFSGWKAAGRAMLPIPPDQQNHAANAGRKGGPMTTTANQLAAALEKGWACDTSPDEMTAAAAELRRLDAEVVALRKDAERYRWLRAYQSLVAGPAAYAPWDGPLLVETELDNAIDAAMKGAAHG